MNESNFDSALTEYASSPTAANKAMILAEAVPKLATENAELTACIAKLQDSLVAAKKQQMAAPDSGELAELRKALTTVADWILPESGQKWPSGHQMSYTAAFGTDGARDYMQRIAADALAATPAQPAADVSAPTDERAYEVFFDGDWKPAPEQAYYCMTESKRRIAANPGSAPSDSIRQLMKFYSASTLEELIETQAKHVERLQSKLPSNQQPAFTRVREG